MTSTLTLDDYCTAQEAASRLGCTVRTVQRLCLQGELQGAQMLAGAVWIVPKASVQAWQPRRRGRPARRRDEE